MLFINTQYFTNNTVKGGVKDYNLILKIAFLVSSKCLLNLKIVCLSQD